MEEFKLSSDDTMRRLRTIAQAPGELQWRIDLVAALERMRISQEISTRSLLQSQARLRKDMAHLTPTKLAELINAQIEEKREKRESSQWRESSRWILSHLGTAIISLGAAYVLYRLKQ